MVARTATAGKPRRYRIHYSPDSDNGGLRVTLINRTTGDRHGPRWMSQPQFDQFLTALAAAGFRVTGEGTP